MLELKEWVKGFLPAHAIVDGPLQLQGIAGDAGFRRYFRVNSLPRLIAVSAPPQQANHLAFINKQQAFEAAGIAVPHIYAVNFEQGYMLQEDLGDQILLDSLSADKADNYYDQAENMLLTIQQMPRDLQVFQNYSHAELLRELEIFPEWFLEKLLNIEITKEVRQLLDGIFQQLIDSALAQPQVVVHRDFHSRNLMLEECDVTSCGQKLYVIDLQDAVIGPVTYDLVSLLRDCYIRWPAGYILQRIAAYQQKLERVGVLSGVSVTTFSRWFDLMGLQRHIKVLGIFARLWLRDGKPQYLEDLPLVLRYTLEQAGQYPELSGFTDWLRSRVIPQLLEQPWYSPWETAGEH